MIRAARASSARRRDGSREALPRPLLALTLVAAALAPPPTATTQAAAPLAPPQPAAARPVVESPAALEAAAVRALGRRDWQAARESYRQLLAPGRGNAESWRGLAIACLGLRRGREARHALECALELAPESRDLTVALAELLEQQGSPAEGRALLDDLIGRDPLASQALLARARNAFDEGDLPAAILDLLHAHALVPGAGEPTTVLPHPASPTDPDLVVCFGESPDRATIAAMISRLYREVGDLWEAARWIERRGEESGAERSQIAAVPTAAEFLRIRALWEAGDAPAAADRAARLPEDAATSLRGLRLRAAIARATSDRDELRRVREQALARVRAPRVGGGGRDAIDDELALELARWTSTDGAAREREALALLTSAAVALRDWQGARALVERRVARWGLAEIEATTLRDLAAHAPERR